MPRLCRFLPLFLLSAWLLPLAGQTVHHPVENAARRALALADAGHCRQALPLLRRAFAAPADHALRKQLGLHGLSCAMTLNQPEQAMHFLQPLLHAYPHDAEVLYLATHVYSDLSILASRALIFYDPDSYQVHELNAEALEVRGQWEQAEGEYRIVLNKDPNLPGIHYRIGRLLLSEPPSKDPATQQDRLRQAAVEFEDELKIDPHNAGAEFVLGELARQAAHWRQAILHFGRATQLDPTFTDAFISLGQSEMNAGQAEAALAPLRTAETQQPANPTIHFMLAKIYLHTGKKAEADREIALFHQTAQQARAAKAKIRQQLMKANESLKPPAPAH